MNEFSLLIQDLNNNIHSNVEFFEKTVRKNPSIVYFKLNELSKFVGKRYNVILEIHFPEQKKIYDVNGYGTENLSIVIDKFRKSFPLSRTKIKQEANNQFGGDINVVDAYMYEGKEGVRIKFSDKSSIGSRIEILPGSFHLWCSIDSRIENFCNWLMLYVYSERVSN
jgi:hypothetical protein